MIILLIIVACIGSGTTALAADHYASPEGTARWHICIDRDKPCALDTANAKVQPGDTVYLLPGSYDSFIMPLESGKSESERIVYKNYDNSDVRIDGGSFAILLDGKSYVSVEGIHAANCHQFLVIRKGRHNDIGHCTFDRNKGRFIWPGSFIYDNSQYNRIHDCTFSRFGWTKDGDDRGAVLDVGVDISKTDATDCNVIENNVFYYGGHHILHICGKNNVVRNNYFHNENWMPGADGKQYGNRNVLTIGPMAMRNLFEGNRFAFAGKPIDDNGANGLVVRCPKNIVRFNMSYANMASGIGMHSMTVSIPTDNCIYNNTLYHNGIGEEIDEPWRCGIAFGNWGNGPLPGNIVVNNIMYDNFKNKAVGGYGDAGPQDIHDNWLEQGDPGFMNDTIPEDTSDASLPDFRLKPDSPCIDKGVFLTTIVCESGSGTMFAVENAGFFFDGWNIPGERGDLIQLEGRKDTARILDIDYGKNLITVDRELTWEKGRSLSLAYYGSSPDLGACEFTGR